MKSLSFRILMLLSIVAAVASHFVRKADVSDFAKGAAAGIWIGLLLVAVAIQANSHRSGSR